MLITKSQLKFCDLSVECKASCPMPDLIARANIEHFKKMLETEKDPQSRAEIKRELAEEEAKLAALLKARDERKKP